MQLAERGRILHMRSNHTAAVLVVALPPVELVAPLEWVEQPVEPPPNVHVDCSRTSVRKRPRRRWDLDRQRRDLPQRGVLWGQLQQEAPSSEELTAEAGRTGRR